MNNPYDVWTPDLQVKALKRCAQAAYTAVFGIALLALSTSLELPVALNILLFFCMMASFVVAGIVFASSGMMSSTKPYGWVQFSDEYCRDILYKSYRITTLGLVTLLAAGFLFSESGAFFLGVSPLSAPKISALYFVSATLIWATSVAKMLNDSSESAEH